MGVRKSSGKIFVFFFSREHVCLVLLFILFFWEGGSCFPFFQVHEKTETGSFMYLYIWKEILEIVAFAVSWVMCLVACLVGVLSRFRQVVRYCSASLPLFFCFLTWYYRQPALGGHHILLNPLLWPGGSVQVPNQSALLFSLLLFCALGCCTASCTALANDRTTKPQEQH